MTRFKSSYPLVAAAVAAATFGAPSRAEATFQLKLTSGAQTLTITDNDVAAGDTDPTTGTITVNKKLGTGIEVTAKLTGYSNSVLNSFGEPTGPNDVARLQLTGLTIRNNGVGLQTLVALLSDDGFNNPVGSPLFMSSSVSGTASGYDSSKGDSVTFASYYDDNSVLYGMTEGTGVQSSGALKVSSANTANLVFSPGSVNDKLVTGSAPFSLTNRAVFNLNAGANVTINGQTAITAAPAPAGVILMASALPCLGLGFWRRFKAQQPLAA